MLFTETLDLIRIDDRIKDLGDTKYPRLLKMQKLNVAYRYLYNQIFDMGADGYFLKHVTLTAPSNRDTAIDLPKDYARTKEISKDDIPIKIISGYQRFYASSWYAYLRSRKIYFGDGVGDAVDFWYMRRPPKLHRGVSQGATSTSFTLAEEALIGTVETSDDYYNNGTIVIVGGTGEGQEREISDYDGDTKIATVSAWTDIPDTTSVYETKNELPESQDFDEILVELTILKLLHKKVPKDLKDDLMEMLEQLSSQNSQNSLSVD